MFSKRVYFALLVLALVVLGSATPLLAQEVASPGGDIGLPAWYDNLVLAGLALAPVTVAVVQVLKAIAARLGLPEGYSGYIVVIVAILMVVVAIGAEFFHVEEEAALVLQMLQLVAETALTVLAALGWYEVGKRAAIIRPTRWSKMRGNAYRDRVA